MKILHILAKVLSPYETGYRIEVNKDLTQLPIGDVSIKLIETSLQLENNKIYYLPEARLENGKVYVDKATLIGELSQGIVNIPEDVQLKIVDRSITPSEL